MSVCVATYYPVCLSICPLVCLSSVCILAWIRLSSSLSICLTLCLFLLCLHVLLSVFLSVCLCVTHTHQT